MRKFLFYLAIVVFSTSCEKQESDLTQLSLLQADIGGREINLTEPISENFPPDRPITLVFSSPLDPALVSSAISLFEGNQEIELTTTLIADNKNIILYPKGILKTNTLYKIVISDNLKGANKSPFAGKEIRFKTKIGALELVSFDLENSDQTKTGRIINVPLDFNINLEFSGPVDRQSLQNSLKLIGTGPQSLQFSFSNNDQQVSITGDTPLVYLSKYTIQILNTFKSASGEDFAGLSKIFYTGVDQIAKFPLISDEELLTKVQEQTFKYFWNFAHENSGLARERNTSGNLVTIGGSGFGVMAILVGIERGFITRQQGIERISKIVDFLSSADRFHGVWPHWINGNTGNVIPFSSKDNGADLVETALMMQGLLSARAYLNESVAVESAIIEKITQMWAEVEWSWFTKGGQDVLYWHWSPLFNWEMNLPIRGYDESLIVYVLAAASPTHQIDKKVYDNGWARNGGMKNGKTFYQKTLPLGPDMGGPLFFSHYSFLGLDPRGLSDQYADYWKQNQNHTLINQAHSINNPLGYVGYSDESWGLTASDGNQGYSAHSPTNDRGVISPTAALSSFPYTPEESTKALHFFYYNMGDRLWGEYGFYDAFNITEAWYADSYLAIDQGPIIIMIENHRSNLLWDLFMSDKDIKTGLKNLNFTH
ncbi:hypothetical protein P872_12540 [Rhodonellum psychrophilum GCM71 = DSM 17998]|uniref:Glycoamylase-like domain-containing protein n=2 Tax=Rhodonellum TaxID=336827 RepID=U5BRW1_9BACT|nr:MULTISPECIES: glucoamylase family protein [Rhodonellum]ERM80638.1 hypothetical protein P872_12540 [Rhodonellum psychrophilum GCM71 = DSM 17998]SDZ57967.1 hypothetical protein SAMN05444412_1325 [Rhodonellum ikkaensis]